MAPDERMRELGLDSTSGAVDGEQRVEQDPHVGRVGAPPTALRRVRLGNGRSEREQLIVRDERLELLERADSRRTAHVSRVAPGPLEEPGGAVQARHAEAPGHLVDPSGLSQDLLPCPTGNRCRSHAGLLAESGPDQDVAHRDAGGDLTGRRAVAPLVDHELVGAVADRVPVADRAGRTPLCELAPPVGRRLATVDPHPSRFQVDIGPGDLSDLHRTARRLGQRPGRRPSPIVQAPGCRSAAQADLLIGERSRGELRPWSERHVEGRIADGLAEVPGGAEEEAERRSSQVGEGAAKEASRPGSAR